MIKLTASTLALALTAGGALAQSDTGSDMSDSEMSSGDAMASADMMGMQGELIRSRDITGGAVYTTNEADDEGWDSAGVYDAIGADWNEIGEIEDIVLSQDGQMRGLVAEVGGFLDLGDKHVMISVDDVSLVAVDDSTYAYVTRLNEEDLESMEGVDEGFWD